MKRKKVTHPLLEHVSLVKGARHADADAVHAVSKPYTDLRVQKVQKIPRKAT